MKGCGDNAGRDRSRAGDSLRHVQSAYHLTTKWPIEIVEFDGHRVGVLS